MRASSSRRRGRKPLTFTHENCSTKLSLLLWLLLFSVYREEKEYIEIIIECSFGMLRHITALGLAYYPSCLFPLHICRLDWYWSLSWRQLITVWARIKREWLSCHIEKRGCMRDQMFCKPKMAERVARVRKAGGGQRRREGKTKFFLKFLLPLSCIHHHSTTRRRTTTIRKGLSFQYMQTEHTHRETQQE